MPREGTFFLHQPSHGSLRLLYRYRIIGKLPLGLDARTWMQRREGGTHICPSDGLNRADGTGGEAGVRHARSAPSAVPPPQMYIRGLRFSRDLSSKVTPVEQPAVGTTSIFSKSFKVFNASHHKARGHTYEHTHLRISPAHRQHPCSQSQTLQHAGRDLK
eukprot:1104056-Prorocentrum_minimum.AAC.3